MIRNAILFGLPFYREGRPEDMAGPVDATALCSRRIVKPRFEAALTY